MNQYRFAMSDQSDKLAHSLLARPPILLDNVCRTCLSVEPWVTVTLTFDLVTQKLVWHVELINVHLHMKFQSCRWMHFDFRAHVKVYVKV